MSQAGQAGFDIIRIQCEKTDGLHIAPDGTNTRSVSAQQYIGRDSPDPGEARAQAGIAKVVYATDRKSLPESVYRKSSLVYGTVVAFGGADQSLFTPGQDVNRMERTRKPGAWTQPDSETSSMDSSRLSSIKPGHF